MDSTSLSVPASSSISSSSGRKKIMLKPGRSLMDWIRFTKCAEDLSSTGGKILEVSSRELAKHDSEHDAWIAIRGRVYNITQYLEYHPGGEYELMRGAGKDATELFNQVHRWVNVESMLEKCLVGVLKKSWITDVPKLPNLKQLKMKHKKSTLEKASNENINESDCKPKEESSQIVQQKSKWLVLPSSDSNMKEVAMRFDMLKDSLKLQLRSSGIVRKGLIIDLVENELYVKLKKTPSLFLIIGLSAVYQEFYEVMIDEGSLLELFFKKLRTSPTEHCGSNIKLTLCDPTDQFIFWPCKLLCKTPVNYNTFLFTFMLPSGTKMWVPMGCHVLIKANIEGTEIMRSYTPLQSYFFIDEKLEDELDGNKITFLIKIYKSGTLTPIINCCKIGENLGISNYIGNFNESFVVNSDSLVMLVAGTGITPMIKIIHYVVNDLNIKRSLQLLFFNKTEEDILWKEELEIITFSYKEFQVYHILSEPDLKWTGYTGQINKDICAQLLTKDNSYLNQRFLICGPTPFTVNALSILEEAGYRKDDIYAFSGS